MRHLPSTLFLVSSLSLAIGSAYAQQAQSQPGQAQGQQGQADIQEVISEFDRDSDTNLSQDEFEQLYNERLQSAGAAPQGGQSQSAEQMFGEIDADSDDQLSSEELNASTELRSQLSQSERSTAGATTGSQAGQSQSERSTAGATTGSQAGQQTERSTAGAAGAGAGAAAGAGVAAGSQTERDTAGATQSDRAGASQTSQVGAASQSSQSSQSSSRELGQTQSSQSQTTAGTTSQSQAGSSQLEQMAMTQPDEIRGKAVKSTEGEDLGEVAELVRSRDDGSVYAVIESGGVLGIGANRAAVKLSELEMEGEDLLYSSSKEQLEQMTYQEAQYEPLDESGEQVGAVQEQEEQDVASTD